MLSGLTIRGRCLLAAAIAAAVCAVILDERDLLRVAAFVAALPLLSLFVCARSRVGLVARRRISPDRVPVGASSRVRISLASRGRLPVGGVTMYDDVPKGLGGAAGFTLTEPPRGQGKSVEYDVRPELRGIHRIGPLRCRVADPFGLAGFERELAGSNRLVAVPRVWPLTGVPAGSGLGAGDHGSHRLFAGHGEDDTTVREYRHGDDMRRVHWKTTARKDELMVRVEERPQHGGVAVLVDNRAAAHRGMGARSSMEWAVSAAASVCLHLHRHGRRVKLVGAAGRTVTGGPETGAEGELDDNLVLDSLAELQPTAQRELSSATDPGAGQALIAILGGTTAAGATELAGTRPIGSHNIALLLDVGAWSGDGGHAFDPAPAAHRLRTAGWSVVTVHDPATPIPIAWENLCEQDASQQGGAR